MLALSARSSDQAVTVVDRPAERRVDVLVGGKPLTSYIYPASLLDERVERVILGSPPASIGGVRTTWAS